jgi:hypothetical protein
VKCKKRSEEERTKLLETGWEVAVRSLEPRKVVSLRLGEPT